MIRFESAIAMCRRHAHGKVLMVILCGLVCSCSRPGVPSLQLDAAVESTEVEDHANTGFEAYDRHWWRPSGRYSGELDTEISRSGLYSWQMDLAGQDEGGEIAISIPVDPTQDHVLSIWIRTEGFGDEEPAIVRLQQFSGGTADEWVLVGATEKLVATGGTHPWRRFSVEIPAKAIKRTTDAVMVNLSVQPGRQGRAWFDDISLVAKGRESAVLLEPQPDESPLARSRSSFGDRSISWHPDSYAEKVSIEPPSDAFLIYDGAAPEIVIRAPRASGATWYMRDYFGAIVSTGRVENVARVRLPGPGYYELQTETRKAGEIDRSFASAAVMRSKRLPVVRQDYPFGSWMQQPDLLDDIGSRWTRITIGWRYVEPSPGRPYELEWESLRRQVDLAYEQGIRLILHFDHVPEWAGSHRLVFDRDRQDDFRAFVQETIRRFGDKVDVWEAINEPFIPDLYPGSLEDLVLWHRIVYEEVHRLDPNAKVIGPCLSPRDRRLRSQLIRLFDMGIGEYLDGISIHTYGGLEDAGFLRDIEWSRRVALERGYDLPVYITEHGLSVPSRLSLERVQASHLVRSTVLAISAGVEAFIWHMMSWPEGESARERDYAIVRAYRDGRPRSPRPAFAAAAVMSDLVGPAKFLGAVRRGEGGSEVFEFEGPGDEFVYVIWEWRRRSREVYFDVAPNDVTLVNIVGTEVPLDTSAGGVTVTATGDPVYLISKTRLGN